MIIHCLCACYNDVLSALLGSTCLLILRDKWIDSGLWSIVQHPNYLGEILLWSGLFISASSTFKTLDYASILSPIFVALLLTKVSGIPILEKQNLRKWKNDQAFLDYMRKTSRLIPYIY